MADAGGPTEGLTIENVVVSSGVGQELALGRLTMDLVGSSYEPESFPGIRYPIEDHDATVLLFRSGKLICTGAGSIQAAERAVQDAKESLADLGVAIAEVPVTVQNLVTSGALNGSVNLNAAAIGLGLDAVEYEPEQFPGLVYRVDEPSAVVLVFGSGRCIVTGTTALGEAATALDNVRDELHELGLLAE